MYSALPLKNVGKCMSTTGKRLPISAVLVIYNEEKLLERCLQSFADLVAEIIVVHDGPCSDHSLEIVRRYNARVFEAERWREAEHHRPFAYRQASHDWILEIDADEYLSHELRGMLPTLISSGADLFEVAWPTVQAGRRYARGYKRSLFNKRKVYFIGATHECIKPSDERAVVRAVESPMLHEPAYDDLSWSVFKKKWIPRSKIHARELLADFSTLPKWNYGSNGWDAPTAVQLAHPILRGMIATPAFIWIDALRRFNRQSAWYFFKYAFFNSLYYLYLFYLVVRGRSAYAKHTERTS
jgi:glycosyltransferase involved in cell wall biosynthesis